MLWVLCYGTRRTVEEIDELTIRHDAKTRASNKGGPEGGGEFSSPMRQMLLAGDKYGGIFAFLGGSLLFVLAAASSSNAVLVERSVAAGLWLFLLGRVLFLRGSRTALCGAFFRTSWRCDVLTGEWRETVPHWARGIGFYKRGTAPQGGQRLSLKKVL